MSQTRRLAACTQAVILLRSTNYIAIELNVLHLKSYKIQLNQCAQAILPLIASLGIDLSVYTTNRVFIVMVALCVRTYSKKKKLDSEILTP